MKWVSWESLLIYIKLFEFKEGLKLVWKGGDCDISYFYDTDCDVTYELFQWNRIKIFKKINPIVIQKCDNNI